MGRRRLGTEQKWSLNSAGARAKAAVTQNPTHFCDTETKTVRQKLGSIGRPWRSQGRPFPPCAATRSVRGRKWPGGPCKRLLLCGFDARAFLIADKAKLPSPRPCPAQLGPCGPSARPYRWQAPAPEACSFFFQFVHEVENLPGCSRPSGPT